MIAETMNSLHDLLAFGLSLAVAGAAAVALYGVWRGRGRADGR